MIKTVHAVRCFQIKKKINEINFFAGLLSDDHIECKMQKKITCRKEHIRMRFIPDIDFRKTVTMIIIIYF